MGSITGIPQQQPYYHFHWRNWIWNVCWYTYSSFIKVFGILTTPVDGTEHRKCINIPQQHAIMNYRLKFSTSVLFETYQLYCTSVIFTSQSYIFLVFICRARITPVSVTLLALLSVWDTKLDPLFLFPVLFSSVCSEFTALGTSTECTVSLATCA